MIKTSNEICRSCWYSKRVMPNSNDVFCDYLHMAGERRGCAVGECDKYTKKEKPHRRTFNDYGWEKKNDNI